MSFFLPKNVFLNLNSASEFDLNILFRPKRQKVCWPWDSNLRPQDPKADTKLLDHGVGSLLYDVNTVFKYKSK